MGDETRWDAIRRRLNEGNCWPSGPVFELLDELEAEAELLCDEGELMKALEELGEATVRIEELEAAARSVVNKTVMLVRYWPTDRRVLYCPLDKDLIDAIAALLKALGEERDERT